MSDLEKKKVRIDPHTVEGSPSDVKELPPDTAPEDAPMVFTAGERIPDSSGMGCAIVTWVRVNRVEGEFLQSLVFSQALRMMEEYMDNVFSGIGGSMRMQPQGKFIAQNAKHWVEELEVDQSHVLLKVAWYL